MKKGCLITIIIVLLIAIGSTWYIYFNLNTSIGDSSEFRFFEVLDGEGSLEIGENLKDEGFIRSPYIFTAYVEIKGFKLFPGIYYLRENMNTIEIAKPLSEGDVQEYKITIPEGYRNTQIAELLASNNIVAKEDFLKASEGKEGYLFPDTYRLSIKTTASEIVDTMIDNFKKKTSGMSPTKEDIIVASIVEREAKKNEDRAKIAGVYLNRIEKNMYLGADPTIQYALGNWEQITKKDIDNLDSPYNTYMYRGLPPSPICNPGLKSIEAVLKPEKNGWIYFFHIKDGTAIFSYSSAEHEANKAKYADQIAN